VKKIARKSPKSRQTAFFLKPPIFGRIYFFKKSPSTFKSRPIGEKSPNLVTLVRMLLVSPEQRLRKPGFHLSGFPRILALFSGEKSFDS
jgi:hypothetical protein